MDMEKSVTPTILGGANNSSNATVCSTQGEAEQGILRPNELFDGKYKIVSKISEGTSQAVVYLAEDIESETQVVIKVYFLSFQPDYDMLEKFVKLDSPYLAKLLRYGTCQGKFYEVYKYYKNGNIMQKVKEGALSEEFIEKVAIVSLNEGLHALHNIGIVHADVKPENILLGDDGQTLVLGDYGISVQLDYEGNAFREIQGTLAYAPRAEQHFNKVKINKAWDYGAMGLVLIALICGVGMFDGMNNDEIFKAWESGIEIPSIITGRLKNLILGLIEYNASDRFGYEEVRRWCEGDIVKTNFKRTVLIEKSVQPLIVAIVDGKVITVNSPEDMSRELLKNWNAARARFFENPTSRTMIVNFLKQFDMQYVEKALQYIDHVDKDRALFCVAYSLTPLKDIYYKNKYLGKLENLFSESNITDNADELMAFLKSDLLDFYLEVNAYSKEVMSSIKVLVDLAGEDSRFLYYLLMFSFAREKVLEIEGEKITSIDALAAFVAKSGVECVLAKENETKLYAWLYCMGYEHEVNLMRKRD